VNLLRATHAVPLQGGVGRERRGVHAPCEPVARNARRVVWGVDDAEYTHLVNLLCAMHAVPLQGGVGRERCGVHAEPGGVAGAAPTQLARQIRCARVRGVGVLV